MSIQKNIVVITNNPNSAPHFAAYAKFSGRELTFLEKNQECLQKLVKQKYSLILIEITHPAMSEIEFVDLIFTFSNQTPIVVISSFFYDTKEIIFGNKIADFIQNPLTPSKLEHCLDLLLGKLERDELGNDSNYSANIDEVMHANKKLSVLFEVSKSLSSITDFDELLKHIITLSTEILNSERATLFIIDREKNQLWSRTAIGLNKEEIRIDIRQGIAGEVALSGETQIIHDPYSHPKFNKEIDLKTGFRTKNILCCPMKNMTGEVIGVIQILNKKIGSFNQDDESFLGAMAASTGIVLENALLHENVKKNLNEIEKAYNDLYVAQNQILKEASFSTISELMGFVSNLMSDSNLEYEMNIFRNKYSGEIDVLRFLELLTDKRSEMMHKINNYVQFKRNEIFG